MIKHILILNITQGMLQIFCIFPFAFHIVEYNSQFFVNIGSGNSLSPARDPTINKTNAGF